MSIACTLMLVVVIYIKRIYPIRYWPFLLSVMVMSVTVLKLHTFKADLFVYLGGLGCKETVFEHILV